MNPENPRAKQQTRQETLTLPPIELQNPAPRKQPRKRRSSRRRRRKFKHNKGDSGSLSSQKSQSSRSSRDRLRVSSLEREMPRLSQLDLSAFRPVFKTYMIMNLIGYGALIPFLWYYQNCTFDDGTMASIDNMIAYTAHIVSIGCVMFSSDVQTTSPYNRIYPWMVTSSLAYLVAKIVCGRDLLVLLEMCVIVGIEGPTIYTIAVYSNTDYTPLTPVLIAAYSCTTVLNVGVNYLVNDSVPVIMLSLISLFESFGICLCVMQFPITKDRRYRLPSNKRAVGGLLVNYAFTCLSYHTYMVMVAIFDGLGTGKLYYNAVNLTFYWEQ